MAQLYSNFKAGTITDNPLSSGATAINSAAFANLPAVVAPDFLHITLDPAAVNGAPEIVLVTAHTASATTCTIVRAQQATTARAHPTASAWEHSLTKSDADFWNNRVMGYAQVTANQTGITTITDLTSLTVTFTAVAGRRYKVTAQAQIGGSGSSHCTLSLRESTTVLQIDAGPIASGQSRHSALTYLNNASISGSKTWKLSLEYQDVITVNGGGTVDLKAAATYPAFILVEDVGSF